MLHKISKLEVNISQDKKRKREIVSEIENKDIYQSYKNRKLESENINKII